MEENDDKLLLSAAEAGVLVGLHPATLRKLASQRKIRTFKVLGALRFKREDLEGLIVERPAQPKDTGPKVTSGKTPIVAVDYDYADLVMDQLYETIEGKCCTAILLDDHKIFLVDKKTFHSVHQKIYPKQRFYDQDLFENHGIYAMRFEPSLASPGYYYFGFRAKRSFADLFDQLQKVT